MSSVPKPGSRPSAAGGQNGWIGTLSTANIGCDRSEAHTTHHRRRESSTLRPGQVWVRFIRRFRVMVVIVGLLRSRATTPRDPARSLGRSVPIRQAIADEGSHAITNRGRPVSKPDHVLEGYLERRLAVLRKCDSLGLAGVGEQQRKQ